MHWAVWHGDPLTQQPALKRRVDLPCRCQFGAVGIKPLNKGKRMQEAYEEYFNGLAKGKEAMSFAEFVEALS